MKPLYLRAIGVWLASLIFTACSAQLAPMPTVTYTPQPTSPPFPTIAAPTEEVLSLKPIVGDTLRVATSADFLPWEYLDKENNLKGFDIELIQEIARRGGVEADIRDYQNFDALLPAVEKGDVHVAIGSITPTEKRRQSVDFSEVYYREYQCIVTAPDLPITINEPKDIVIYNIGVITNTALDKWVIEELVRPGLLPLNNLNRYDSADALVYGLTTNAILIGLLDSSTAVAYESDHKLRILLTEQIVEDGPAIAIQKGNHELKQMLDKLIDKMLHEGFIDQLAEKYFRQQVNP